MSDYRTMFDKDYIGAWDLDGKDRTLVIESVFAGKVGHGNKATKKPVIRFRGARKAFACNVTNARAIAGMYGNDTRGWVGQAITIYPTMADFGGKQVDAIRVRPVRPRGPAQERLEERPVDPEMRARQNEASDAADEEPSDANEDA